MAVAGLLGAMCLALPASQAQPKKLVPVENLLPANSVIYLSWDGRDAHRKAWEQTAAFEAFEKTGVLELVDKLVAFGAAQFADDGKLFEEAYRQIAAKGISAAVSVSSDPLPVPTAYIVLHGGAQFEPAISELVQKAAGDKLKFERREVEERQVTSALIPDTPGVEVGWYAEGEHLVIVAGINAIDRAVDIATGETPNLSSSSLWKAQRNKKDGIETSFVGWLNWAAVRKAYGTFPIPDSPNPNRPITGNGLLTALGVEKVEHVVFRSGYKGRALWSDTVVSAPGPKRGLMAIADQKPFTLASLPALPEKSRWFTAVSVDSAKLVRELIETVRRVAAFGPPGTLDQVSGAIQQLPDLLQFDPLRDLLDALGNVHCVYDDAQNGFAGFGFGLALQVKDELLLRKTIGELLGRLIDQQSAPVQVAKWSRGGTEVTTLQVKSIPFAPSFAIERGWLIVTLMPQGVESFLLRQDKKLPVWKPDAGLEVALKDLPKEFVSLTVTDPRQTYPMLLSYAPMLLSFAQMGLQQSGRDDLVLPIGVADLPPAELIAQPLFTNVSMCVTDEKGIHCVGRSSVPAVPLIGGDGGSVATPAIVVALVLPAVQQARAAARRTVSSNNLKQLAIAMHNFHAVNEKLPTGTQPHPELKPEERLSWVPAVLPFFDQQRLVDSLDPEKGWRDPANEKALQVRIPLLHNPNLPLDNTVKLGPTHYVGVAGVGKDAPTLKVTHKRAGMFGYDRVVRLQDVRDGTSQTIMLSEVNKEIGAWGAGGKPTVRGLTTKPYINGPDGFGGGTPKAMNVVLGDGSVRTISEFIDPDVLEALSTIAGGETERLDP